MKKILFVVMAAVAIGFTSCGNKAQNAEAPGSEVVVNVDEDIAALTAGLNENNANKLQEALDAIKAKVEELIKTNPDAAKEYVAKVQNFLKENADKVKSVVGDNAAVSAAVSALTEVEPESVVSGLLESVGDKATEAKDAAVDAVNEKVENAKEAVENKAEEVKDAAKEKANEAVDKAADKVKKGLGL